MSSTPLFFEIRSGKVSKRACIGTPYSESKAGGVSCQGSAFRPAVGTDFGITRPWGATAPAAKSLGSGRVMKPPTRRAEGEAMPLTILVAPMNPLWSYLALLGLIVVVVLALGVFGMLVARSASSSSSSNRYSTFGNALMRVEAGFLPGREHIAEAVERDDAEEDGQGDPPETGKT